MRGFIPIVILVLLAVIAGSIIVVSKQLPALTARQDLSKSFEGSTSGNLRPTFSPTSSPTPSFKTAQTKASSAPAPTVKTSPSASTSTASQNSSSNTSSGSSSSSNSSGGSTTSNTSNNSSTTPTPSTSSTPSPSSTTYSVSLTGPNGGTYNQGDTVHITWNASGTFNIFTLSATDQNGTGYNIGSTTDSNARSFDWTANIGNSAVDRQLTIQLIANKYPQYIGDPNATQKTSSGITITVKK